MDRILPIGGGGPQNRILFGQPDGPKARDSEADMKVYFEGSEIVPDVLNVAPSGYLFVEFDRMNGINLGNVMLLEQVQRPPVVRWPQAEPDEQYTLIFTDPDYPSRNDSSEREYVLWVVANIKGSDLKEGNVRETGKEIVEWKPPDPGNDPEFHRYVFVVFDQKVGEVIVDNEDWRQYQERVKFKTQRFARKHLQSKAAKAGNFFHLKSMHNPLMPEELPNFGGMPAGGASGAGWSDPSQLGTNQTISGGNYPGTYPVQPGYPYYQPGYPYQYPYQYPYYPGQVPGAEGSSVGSNPQWPPPLPGGIPGAGSQWPPAGYPPNYPYPYNQYPYNLTGPQPPFMPGYPPPPEPSTTEPPTSAPAATRASPAENLLGAISGLVDIGLGVASAVLHRPRTRRGWSKYKYSRWSKYGVRKPAKSKHRSFHWHRTLTQRLSKLPLFQPDRVWFKEAYRPECHNKTIISHPTHKLTKGSKRRTRRKPKTKQQQHQKRSSSKRLHNLFKRRSKHRRKSTTKTSRQQRRPEKN